MMLGHQGRFGDALAERQRALSLDPFSLRFNTSVADTLTAMLVPIAGAPISSGV